MSAVLSPANSSAADKRQHTNRRSFQYTTSSHCYKTACFVFQAHHIRKGGNLDGKNHVQEQDQAAVQKKPRAASYHCDSGFPEAQTCCSCDSEAELLTVHLSAGRQHNPCRKQPSSSLLGHRQRFSSPPPAAPPLPHRGPHPSAQQQSAFRLPPLRNEHH